MAQFRNWCFTDFELLDWDNIFRSEKIRYVCWGSEVCPKTKRKHYQGWIQFEDKKRLTALKAITSDKLHLEVCKGTEGQNEKYCQKDNEYKCLGEFTVQGQRSDLTNCKRILDGGGTMLDVAEANFGSYVRYNRGFEKYKTELDNIRRKEWRHVEVILFYGKTGIGKTRTAMEFSPFKIQGSDLKWWDGYNGERDILIDEYSNNVKITELLAILDGHRLRLPVKGGFTYAGWTRVFITTNLYELHSEARHEHKRALARRITTKTDNPVKWYEEI